MLLGGAAWRVSRGMNSGKGEGAYESSVFEACFDFWG